METVTAWHDLACRSQEQNWRRSQAAEFLGRRRPAPTTRRCQVTSGYARFAPIAGQICAAAQYVAMGQKQILTVSEVSSSLVSGHF